jgi:hypothetical protein
MPLVKRTTTTKPAAAPAGRSRFNFKYKPRTAEEVRERAMRNIGGRDSYFTQEIQFFTPREGENNVRILPPPPDADWGHYGIALTVHYDIGADHSAYLCLQKMQGKSCPACEERKSATAAGEEDYADALRPNERVAVFVIDRSAEGKGPQLWNVAGGMDKDILKLLRDPGTGEVLPVDDPENGYDLSFIREGTGLKTKYKGLQFARRDSPLSDDPEEGQKWLDYVVEHRLDEQLIYFEADYISNVLAGQPPPKTADKPNGTDTAPVARTGRARRPEAEAPTPTPAPAAKPRAALRPRVAAAPAPEPSKAEVDAATGGDNLPTWDELQQLDEDGLAQLGDEAGVQFPEAGFESIDDLRDFIAQTLDIEKPAPVNAAPAASGGSWRDRLNRLNKPH